MDIMTKTERLCDVDIKRAREMAWRLHRKKEDLEVVSKVYAAEKTEAVPGERAVISYITTDSIDRDDEVLMPDGMIGKSYDDSGKPVLWGHNIDLPEYIVGQNIWYKADPSGHGIIAKTVFRDTPFADDVYKLYTEDIAGQGPICKGWSVRFIPIEWENGDGKKGTPRRTYTKWELLEYSTAPLQSNRDALTIAYQKGIITSDIIRKSMDVQDPAPADAKEISNMDTIEKGVIGYHDYGNEDPKKAWDGGAAMKADPKVLKKICAWFDPDNADVKSGYKLPHHDPDSLKANLHGVNNAMARLSKTDIPAADKKGVAAHLMKHQGDFKGKSLTNFRAKALDADGLPSADDIRGAIHFALQGVEIDGMASPPCDCMGPSVTEVYPTDYPNGHAICGYRMADGSYEYAQFDYTYDEDGVTIDGDIVPVNLSWIPEDPEKEVGQGEEKIAPDATSTLIAAIASLQKSFETTMAHNLELAASAAKVAAPAPEPAKIEEPTVQAVTPAPVSVDIIGAGGDLKAAVLEAIRGMDIKAVVREGMAIELAKIKGQVDA